MRALVLLLALAGCDKAFGLGGRVDIDAPPADAPPDEPGDAPDALVGYAAQVLADSPLSYYRLNETSGVICNDSVGEHNGTYGGSFMLDEPGLVEGDTAVSFAGTSGGITFGDVFEFDQLKPFSLEAWLSISDDSHFNNIINKYADPQVATGYLIYTGFGKLACARGVTQQNQTLVEYEPFEENLLVHVVCTFDGSMLRLYINGTLWQEKSSAGVVLPNQTIPFVIGAGNGSITSGATEGTIDEVAIYSSALPAERINAHYVTGHPPR